MYNLHIISPKFAVNYDRKSADGQYQLSVTRAIIGRYRLIPTNLCTARNITVTHSLNIVSPSAFGLRKRNKRRINFQIAEGLLFRSAVSIFRYIQPEGLLVVSSLCWCWASCIVLSVIGDHMQAWSFDVCVGILHLHHLHRANPGRIHTTCLSKHRCS
jgi:hypothetical protein